MLDEFHFIEPLWLLALLPLALILFGLIKARVGASPWRDLIDPALQPLLLDGAEESRRVWPWWLLGIAWLTAVISLANPTFNKLPAPMLQSQAARVIVLDLSRSMYATDTKPSRIERARFKVADILNYDSEGQTGLVVFAGDAFTVAPLTRDKETVETLLMATSPDIMPVQGSRLGLGLKLAADILSQAGVAEGQVIAVTDGLSSGEAIDQAEKLFANGHRVSVLGVGTPTGGPIADRNGNYLRDNGGQVVIAKLDRTRLAEVATAGGGTFKVLSADDSDIQALLSVGSGSVQDASGAVDEGLVSRLWEQRGPLLALCLLPLAALAFRRGWLIAFLIVVGMGGHSAPAVAGFWEDFWWRRDQQAEQAFHRGDFDAARALSQDSVLQGSADYRRGDYESAAETFAEALSADAAYNLGNALANLGRLQEAVDAYDEALRREVGMEDAIANREAVLEALEQQQDQQQGEGEGEGDGESQSDSDDAEGEGESGEGEPSESDQAGDSNGDETEGEDGTGAESQSESEAGDGSGQQNESFADAAEQLQDQSAEGEQADQSPASEQGESGLDESVSSEPSSEQDGNDGDSRSPVEAEQLSTEEQLAAEQWLRRIPDDPGGLLRRKFRYQYRRRPAPPSNNRQTW